MDVIIKLFFEYLMLGFWKAICFMLTAVLGFMQILFKLQYQRFFTFVSIVILVWCDLCLVAPGCSSVGGNCIHFFIILAPFIYLSEVYKKGVVD